MSEEIVNINRAEYDILMANTAKLESKNRKYIELKELIKKEGYSITTNCEGTKLIIFKNTKQNDRNNNGLDPLVDKNGAIH